MNGTKRNKAHAAISGLLILAGCASWEVPTTGMVAFTSEPSGAEVFVNGGYHGRTPVTVRFPREMDYAVTFRLAGYLDRSYRFSLRSNVMGQPKAELTEPVHGVLTPSATASAAAPESSATTAPTPAAAGAPRPTSTLSPEVLARARGTIGGPEEPKAPSEAKAIYFDKNAPVTVVLTDGSILTAASVEQAPSSYLKVYLLDGTSQFVSKHKVRSVASPGPNDWTKAVLDEGKNVPPR